jgi:flagellar hook-associated protein 2
MAESGSSISTGGVNGLGIVGLNSGMDTAGTIKKIMKYDRKPLDRTNQEVQLLEWKEEAFRTQNTALSSLRDSVFDLKMETAYDTRKIDNSSPDVVDATTDKNAVNGSYAVKVDKMATFSTNCSTDDPTSTTKGVFLSSQVIGTAKSLITIDKSKHSFDLTVDGTRTTINLSKLSGKYSATGEDHAKGLTPLIGGPSKSLTRLAENIEREIKKALHKEKIDDISIKVKVTSNNQLEFYTDDGLKHNITLNSIANNSILSDLGFKDGATVSTVDTSTSLFNLRDQFVNGQGHFTAKSSPTDSFQFTINGQTLKFTNNDSIDKIVSGINSSAAGVKAFFDTANNKLMLTATESGDYNHGRPGIVVDDTDGVLKTLFKIDQANSTVGENAEFSVNGTPFKQAGNSFTINGVTLKLTGTGSSTVNVSSDTTNIVKKIGDFITAYNTALSGMNEQINKTRPTKSGKHYDPLTDDQKEQMTEEQIKKWEKLGQEGLLNNDRLMITTVNDLRSKMSRVIETPISLEGGSLAGSVNVTEASNQFSFTLGDTTKIIKLDPKVYSAAALKSALQAKLDESFGVNRVKVSATDNKISFTTQNVQMQVNSGIQNDILSQLGFMNGDSKNTSYNTLSQIGITTGDYSENGKLHLNTAKLTAALEKDPDGVIRLLTNNQQVNPVSESASDKANAAQLTADSQGIFTGLYAALNTNIKRLTDEAGLPGGGDANSKIGKDIMKKNNYIDTVQKRLDSEEKRLWKVFSGMETSLNKIANQASMVSSMMG